MRVWNLFSKREKERRGEITDVFAYDTIPYGLRVQIVLIITDAIGEDKDSLARNPIAKPIFEECKAILAREHKSFVLFENARSLEDEILNYFLKEQDVNKVIDIIEIFFTSIDKTVRNTPNYAHLTTSKITPDDAIGELNVRFKENAVGYQFAGGEIVRLDSTYMHSEIVLPTIQLLSNRKFQGANEEYLRAHEHYRHGRNQECLNECLKAFESTMKIICKEKGWAFDPNKDTSSKLISICLSNNLIPNSYQSQFTSLRAFLAMEFQRFEIEHQVMVRVLFLVQ